MLAGQDNTTWGWLFNDCRDRIPSPTQKEDDRRE
jgi:hypothetical protein